MLPFINIRYCCAAVMCSIWLTAVCAHQSVTLRSSTGDEVTIDYNVSPQEGKVIISFDYVNDYLLGNRNKLLYYRYLDKGEIRIFFLDDTKFSELTKVKPASTDIQHTSFTTPDGWTYEPLHRDYDHVFLLNDMYCKPEISFSGDVDKQTLTIPVYLAYITRKAVKNLIGKKKYTITTYNVFSEFEPLTIELFKPATSTDISPINNGTKTIDVPVEEDVLVPGSDSPEVPLPSGPGGGGADSNSDGPAVVDSNAADSTAQGNNAADDPGKDDPGSNRDTWLMFIITAVLGMLGFGGSQLLQYKRSVNSQRNLEDMQRRMVQRAENEAKRRAQSMVRNKTHQVVGKAKQKGRQAVRSGVKSIGDKATGKNVTPRDTPATGNQPSSGQVNRPSVGNRTGTGRSLGNRRPRPGKNGEISI